MKFVPCEHCGVVVDFDSYALDRDYILNHDQDKACEAVKCPLCKEWIPSGDWEEIKL